MRKVLALTTAAAALGVGLAAAPAGAAACTPSATCASTTIATVVDVGTLAIVASPVGTAGLGFTSSLPTSGATQSVTNAADLTLTTVTDTRLAGTGWTVTANLTDFAKLGGGTAIPKSAALLSVPAPTKVLGAVGMALSSVTTPTAVDATSGDLASFAAATSTGGLNTVTYTPHIDLTVPAGTVAGTYTATLTQSVA